MKSTCLVPLFLLGIAPPARGADAPPIAAAASSAASAPAAESAHRCFYTNPLPAELKYTVLTGKLKASKGIYGSVPEMLPRLAAQVRAAGGDAVINYNGGQHFGFWPWRITHPIVTGAALKWDAGQPVPDCQATAMPNFRVQLHGTGNLPRWLGQ